MTAQHRTVGSLCDTAPVPQEADDGMANTCRHDSATGIDTTPWSDPGKVWRCDHCGLRWTQGPGGERVAVPQDTDRLSELAAALSCSQCGRPFTHPACGPTHAIVAADPTRHRLIETLLAAERERGRAEVEQVDALRSAAKAISAIDGPFAGGGEGDDAAQWLEARAQQIERKVCLDRARAYRGGDDRG